MLLLYLVCWLMGLVKTENNLQVITTYSIDSNNVLLCGGDVIFICKANATLVFT